MSKGIGKEIILIILFFGSVWAIVSFYSEDEVDDWNIIPNDLQEKLGDFVLDDLDRKSSLELVANDSFSLDSWSEILVRLDFNNSDCRAIYITNNSEINAYTLPGDNILIHSGLIDFLDSGEELAAVLAHEMGHVAHDHVEEMLAEQFALTTLVMIVAGEGGAGLLLELSDVLFTAAFSRENEREADVYGLKLLEKGSLPADGMLRFFKKLDEKNLDIPEILSAFSSHPLNEERIEFVQNYADKESENQPMDMNWSEFKDEMLELTGQSNK